MLASCNRYPHSLFLSACLLMEPLRFILRIKHVWFRYLSATRTSSHIYLFSLIESASPWPKFDKAVSELHDWLDTLSEMMKTEKTVLGDSEDMEGLLEKQKVKNDFVA